MALRSLRSLYEAWQRDEISLTGSSGLPASFVEDQDAYELHRGKVRDCVFDKHNHMIRMYHSDRLSAYDQHVGIVPYRGVILAALSSFWFSRIPPTIPHYFTGLLDERTMEGHLLQPFAVEVIVRDYMAGSMWRDVQKGRDMPYVDDEMTSQVLKGMSLYEKLPQTMVHITTKAETTYGSDRAIAVAQAVDEKRLSMEEWQKIKAYALKLFAMAKEHYLKHGWVLADTKLEFARSHIPSHNGIALIDEIFSPDSSRLWTFADALDATKPVSWDKDLVREYLSSHAEKHLPKALVIQLALSYLDVCEKLLGAKVYV